jgi:pyridoxamine 5'-phosphate oxidase-like protein
MSYARGASREPVAGRPHMPAEYGIDPSGAGLVSWNWALEQLHAARNYWVCTVSPDGRPHAAPVWGVMIDGTLYFSTDTRSAKGRNLLANPRITVHLESGDEVVILEGVVERFDRTDDVPDLAAVYQAKYGFDVTTLPGAESAWFALRPTVAHGWREADFQMSATRWEF